jgi:hypothetical protein
MVDGKQVEDINGSIEGEDPFFSRGGYNKRPTAVLTPSTTQTVELGTVVSLSGAGSFDDDGTIASYEWKEGATQIGTGSDVQVTVDQAKTITLTVTDDGGAIGTASVQLRVIGQDEIAEVYYQDTQFWGQVCIHYSTNNEASWTAAPGDEMNWIDGNWHKSSIILEPGVDLVFVTNNCQSTWDNNGGQDYRLAEGIWNLSNGVINAGIPEDLDGNKAPTARISPASQSVDVGTALTLSAEGSTDPEGTALSYRWNTGETTSTINIVANATATYSVTVTDAEGATGDASVTITAVQNQAPTANILPGSSSHKLGTSVTLDASSSTDIDGTITGYLWSNGATTQSITVTVTEQATYSVTVTDDDGATGSNSVTLSIQPNTAPTAVITPGNSSYPAGTIVTLSAANSTDSDGTIAGYLWSTGETTATIDVTVDVTKTISVVVTDDEGATGSSSVTLTLDDNFQQTFASLHFRGTANNWSNTAMTLVADHVWKTTQEFDGQNNQRFKFDVAGDWSQNYGDNNNDGVAEQSGGDIFNSGVGTYDITFNDSTLQYTVKKVGGPEEYTRVLTSLNFRGTANNWSATPMTLVANNTWSTTVTFDGQANQRFKFDELGDWSNNYGDNNNDGILEQTGNDILTEAIGNFVITVNDSNMSYTVIAE